MENDFSLQLNKALCQGWLKLSNCIWKRRRNCEYVITMTWLGVFYLWQSRIGIALKILDRSINFWIKYMLPSFSYVHEARSDYGHSQTLFEMQHAASGDITRQNFRATSGLIFCMSPSKSCDVCIITCRFGVINQQNCILLNVHMILFSVKYSYTEMFIYLFPLSCRVVIFIWYHSQLFLMI